MPTKCEDCGKIKALYEVQVKPHNLVVLTYKVKRWICLECWQLAASDKKIYENSVL